MKKTIIAFLSVALMLVVFARCNSSKYPTVFMLDSHFTPTLRVAEFRITDEFTGWKEDANGYATFNDAISLQHLIDGGYEEYSNNGLLEGMRQTLVTSDQRNNQVYVMDFGASEQAAYMYNFEKSRLSRTTVVGYSDTVAIGYPILGGVTVYAHFDKFYFQASLTGYSSLSTSVSDANLFLGFYEKMVHGG